MRVSPGLSSFAADTARVAESLRPLMEFSKEKVGTHLEAELNGNQQQNTIWIVSIWVTIETYIGSTE
ncbi:hypothetical protein ZWY2020_044514 [Hordeum vulgare]|nr:hypothetical protein ZWY2020_044514 [Hordeum vulgare]